MTFRSPTIGACLLLALAGCGDSGTAVDPNKVTELTVALSDLEKRVTTLEKRVREMEPPALTMPVDTPEWVAAGSHVDGENPNLIFGVGQAIGLTNPTLARSSADEDAKRAILGIIREQFELTAKGKAQRTTLTAVTITGVKFTEHWEHPDGTMYALGELNLKAHPQLGIKLKEPEPEKGATGDAGAAAKDGKDGKDGKDEAADDGKTNGDAKKRKKTKRKKTR